jgi:hypothetical protein
MAQNRNLEVTAPATSTSPDSVAELRAAIATTRMRIGRTVDAIDDRLSTLFEDLVPGGRTGSPGADGRTLITSAASIASARMVARWTTRHTTATSRWAALGTLGAILGVWLWNRSIRSSRRPTATAM